MPLQLIESYLTDREQCVQVNDVLSDYEAVLHGVPQGSILGPLFFLLYINDIAQSSKILSFYLFADDTTILHSEKDIDTLERTINDELVHVSDWLTANKLSLNVKKSNVLVFRTKNSPITRKIRIKINGTDAEEKNDAKYLGVMIDNKLSYVSHINHVKAKLTKGNAILAKVRHFVPHNLLKNTYHAHFQPHLDYGLTVWGHAAPTNLDVINRQQRKAIRIMSFKKSDFKETDQLFKNNEILPLSSCRDLNSSKVIWRAGNSSLNAPINSLFKQRENNTFHLPHRRIGLTQSCTSYQGVQVWNRLPSELRTSPSLNVFKRKYKDYLLDKL